MIGGRSALLSAASGPGYGNWTGNYEDVSLLLRGGVPALIPIDESPAPKDVEVVGRPSINTTLFKYGDSALDFPGALGNHYSILDLNNFTPGLGAWTVEAWLYRKSAADWVIMSGSNFKINGNSTLTVVGDSAVNRILISSVPALNTWVHVATVRESNGTIRLFFNGIQQASSTGSLSTATTTGILIGGKTAGATASTDALLDDVRVTVGVARYTANFTPPTAELPANITDDPNYNDVSLLLRGAATIGPFLVLADESPTPKQLNLYNDIGISETTWKYSGSSLAFGGGHIRMNGEQDFAFGLGDFTIEFWINFSTILSVSYGSFILDQRPSPASQFMIFAHPTAGFGYKRSGTMYSNTPLSLNTWYHFALAREASTTRMFVDGILKASAPDALNIGNSLDLPIIGGDSDGPGYRVFTGYIDDLRITKGVARYTKNFLPPPAELPAI